MIMLETKLAVELAQAKAELDRIRFLANESTNPLVKKKWQADRRKASYRFNQVAMLVADRLIDEGMADWEGIP